MDDSSNNPDRAILESPKAYWADDPDENLTEAELDSVLTHFSASANAGDPLLRSSVKMQFQSFMVMAMDEGFRERDGHLKKVPKPSTTVARQMEQVQKACEKLNEQLAGLDPATRTWLDQHLKEIGVKDESGNRVRLRHLKKSIYWPVDLLINAARYAEGIATRGPNNTALKVMIEKLAYCWEKCHGRPPTTDKGRGRQDDPFLEFCQEMAGIAHARLREKGGGLGTLQLSGLVADFLKNRHSRT